MIERVVSLLKDFKEINDYRLVASQGRSHQVFYILDKVETVRTVDLANTCVVTLYVDYEDERGQASVTLHSSFTDEEIKEKLAEAIKQTVYSKNTYFALPSGECKEFPCTSNIQGFTNDLVFKIAESVYKASTFKDGWLSSIEVFVNESKVRILNSKGVDYTYFTNSISIEVIPTFKNEKEEIELYTNLDYADLDFEQITKDTYEFLLQAELRNKAVKYNGPKTIRVMLDKDEIKNIFFNLVDNLNYAYCYNKMDLLKVGDKFYGDGLDMPNISLVPYVRGSVANRSVDADGIVLNPTKIVEDNVVLTNHGSNQYAYYLGIKEATGSLPNLKIEKGKGIDLSKDYLHCLSFSSFQFDIFSGNFGGEVRLALYVHDGVSTPVTGLTVSGNIHELKSHLNFASEVVETNKYAGPEHLMISDMNVN